MTTLDIEWAIANIVNSGSIRSFPLSGEYVSPVSFFQNRPEIVQIISDIVETNF